jgi:hypothetical protein
LAALVLGILGLKHRKLHPESKGSVHAWIGIVLGGGMALIWLSIFIFSIVMAALDR